MSKPWVLMLLEKIFWEYVSIKDQWRCYYVRPQFESNISKQSLTHDVLEDLRDGKIIKNNTMVHGSPSPVFIVLCQDSFEVDNRLGEDFSYWSNAATLNLKKEKVKKRYFLQLVTWKKKAYLFADITSDRELFGTGITKAGNYIWGKVWLSFQSAEVLSCLPARPASLFG